MTRCFAIFAIPCAILLYAPGLNAPLYLDDSDVLSIIRLSVQPRGMGLASFWLNDQINAVVQTVFAVDDPFLFRLGNVFIHALGATALFWLTQELTRKWTLAWAAATLFLVHPIQTQAVTYIAQRFETQATLFMLLSAAAYVRFRNRGDWQSAALSTVCAVAAAFTKETAIILPVWLLLIEAVFFDVSGIRKRAPYLLILAALLSYPALIALRSSGNTFSWIPWHQYLLTQGPVLAKYLQLVVYPRELFLFYDFPPIERLSFVAVAQWGLVLAVAATGCFLLRRHRLIGFGILTFFTLLLPVTLLPLPDIVFQHRLNPALAGAALAAAGCLSLLPARAALILFLIIVGPLEYRTMQRNREWTDPVHFFEAHRERFPTDPIVLVNLSVQYANHSMLDKALDAARTARQFENRANSYYRNHVGLVIATNLGFEYLEVKQFDDALEEANRVLRLDPKNIDGLWVLGSAQLGVGNRPAARETFRTLVVYDPENRRAWIMLKNALDGPIDSDTATEIQQKIDQLAATPPRHNRQRLHVSPAYRGFVIVLFGVLLVTVLVWTARTLREARHLLAGATTRA